MPEKGGISIMENQMSNVKGKCDKWSQSAET